MPQPEATLLRVSSYDAVAVALALPHRRVPSPTVHRVGLARWAEASDTMQ